MAKPPQSEIPPFYRNYVELVQHDHLTDGLTAGRQKTLDLFGAIPEKTGGYRYASDKWTVKQVLAHIIDTERVFAYRALTFARNDKTELPGFDQDEWALETGTDSRKLHEGLIEEYDSVRTSTIALFGSFSEAMLARTGVTNGNTFSVSTFGYIILGHELHHHAVLLSRYIA